MKRTFGHALGLAALAAGCLLATAPDALAFGKRCGGGRGSSSSSCGAAVSSGGCSTGCGVASSFSGGCDSGGCGLSAYSATPTQNGVLRSGVNSSGQIVYFYDTQPAFANPAAPGTTTVTASPALPGVGPTLIPDVVKSLPTPPLPSALPMPPGLPTDLVPVFTTDKETGKPKHAGWLRGTQFIPAQP